MKNSGDEYYTELLRTKEYCNNRNDAPLSNENIQKPIHKVIEEDELDAHNITLDDHNVTADTFS